MRRDEIVDAARLWPVSYTHLDVYKRQVDGHALINLRWLSSRLARETRNGLPQVTIRFRAAIETL